MPDRAFSSSSRTRMRYGSFMGRKERGTAFLHASMASQVPQRPACELVPFPPHGVTARNPFVSLRTGLQSVHHRLVRIRRGDDAADLAIEPGLRGGERS